MVSSLNLNFSFTQPLSLLRNKNIFGVSAQIFKNNGYMYYSFFYNSQNQIATAIIIVLLAQIAKKLYNKLHTRKNKLLILLCRGCKYLNNKHIFILAEMYFQQRMNTYLCFMHYISRVARNDFANCSIIYEFLAITAFVYIELKFIKRWIIYLFTLNYCTSQTNRECLFGIQYEVFSTSFQFLIILLQSIFPILLVFAFPNYLKLISTIIIFLALSLYILTRVHFENSKKVMASYFVNYICIFLFSGLWLVFSKISRASNNSAIGWIMNILLLLPIFSSAILFLPQSFIELKAFILKIRKQSTKKQHSIAKH